MGSFADAAHDRSRRHLFRHARRPDRSKTGVAMDHHHVLRRHFFLRAHAQLLVAALLALGHGLGVGGEWGTGHALISETFPANRRGRFGAVMQSGAPIGVGLATIMGAFFARTLGGE